MDPKQMKVETLKALAFDILVEIERHQKNLQVLSQELASRESNPKESKKEEIK